MKCGSAGRWVVWAFSNIGFCNWFGFRALFWSAVPTEALGCQEGEVSASCYVAPWVEQNCQAILFKAPSFPKGSLASSNTYFFFWVHTAFSWGTTSHPFVLQRQLFYLGYHYICIWFCVLVWIRCVLWKLNSHPLCSALVHTANAEIKSLLQKMELEDVLFNTLQHSLQQLVAHRSLGQG